MMVRLHRVRMSYNPPSYKSVVGATGANVPIGAPVGMLQDLDRSKFARWLADRSLNAGLFLEKRWETFVPRLTGNLTGHVEREMHTAMLNGSPRGDAGWWVLRDSYQVTLASCEAALCEFGRPDLADALVRVPRGIGNTY